jgi:glycosyltransferase involved in cell wall biosynthesis
VLHVAAYYAPAFVYGGPPRSVHALCGALRREGVDVQVFTTDANGAQSLPASITGAATFEDVPVRYFPRTFPRTPIGSRPLGEALRRELAGYDVVHIHGLWNRVVWAAARAASRASVPYVLSPRGMLQQAARAHRGWRKRAGWALIESRVVHGAAVLHATSDSERDTLTALGTGARVTFIPNGVDLGGLERRPAAPPIVLFVGRIHPIKRVDLLIDAFAAVRERRCDARLVIAGPDEMGLMVSLAERAGRHAEAITWLGAVGERERAALLAQAATLVMCSDSESFGMSALEAMASGVPVVVTQTCPWRAIAEHDAGYWVGQSAHDIAAAVMQVLDDPLRAHAMGERGRQLAASAYGWRTIASAFALEYAAMRRLPAVDLQVAS